MAFNNNETNRRSWQLDALFEALRPLLENPYRGRGVFVTNRGHPQFARGTSQWSANLRGPPVPGERHPWVFKEKGRRWGWVPCSVRSQPVAPVFSDRVYVFENLLSFCHSSEVL
ncbi:hypothetical protein CDAR_286131 [Caerostris darwini]|uniref:Uncharacterized protein n=1 Tax=Caerostris darwini TaxID=1538125 RepID=A0AAV4N5X1_9ARAC|nr:hypothetical protein CDAR_286131 [Caerostris darwini]